MLNEEKAKLRFEHALTKFTRALDDIKALYPDQVEAANQWCKDAAIANGWVKVK